MKIQALDIRGVLNSPPPALDFVLPGLLAGTVGMIVGPGAVGKTTFLIQLAMSLAAGNSIGCGLPFKTETPGKVVLVAAEETASILSHRLHAIHRYVMEELSGSFLDGVTAATVMDSWANNLCIVPTSSGSHHLTKGDVATQFYTDLCAFAKGARLVIVDPLRRLHGGDENDSAAMTDMVQALERLARKTGAAVIVAHHANKVFVSGTGSAATASRGSSALTDGVRWQLNLSKPPRDSEASNDSVPSSIVQLEFVKTNYLAPQRPVLLRRTFDGVLMTDTSAKVPQGAKGARATKGNGVTRV